MYREGRLGNDAAKKLLPVTIRDERLVEAVKVVEAASPSLWGRSRSTSPKGMFTSRGEWIWWCCAPRWSVCSDDRAAGRDAHLDRCRSDGSAARIYGTEWTGADDPSGESVLRSCVRVSWAARRSDQDVVVGRRWAVSLREKDGARKINLDARLERSSGAVSRTVLHGA